MSILAPTSPAADALPRSVRAGFLRLIRLDSPDALRTAAAQWDDLWERAPGIAPSMRAASVADWLEQFAPGAPVRALAVEQEGRWVAALPLYGHRVKGPVRMARLPSNGWATNGDLLLDPNTDPAAAMDCLVRGMAELPWSLVWLPLVSYEEPAWKALLAAAARAGMPCLVEPQYRIPQVEIGSDWDAYDRSRDGDGRRSRRRYARMLERDGGVELELHAEFRPGELDRLLRLGFEIEDRSWKGAEGTSVLKQPGLYEFTRREAHRLAERGELRLAFLKLAGEPVAFSYQWRSRGVQYCVKLGYDDAYRRYGPGQQLMMRLLQRLHEDPDCRLVDFWGRSMEWNETWATRSYPVGRVLIANRGTISRSLFRLGVRWLPRLRSLAEARRRAKTREAAGAPGGASA